MADDLNFDKDRVLERVRKLMALANDKAASEGERDNATRMAHATLAKYNLSLAEANAAGERTAEGKRLDQFFEGKDFPWCRTVAHALGNLFFCSYFSSRIGGGKVKHYFVGKEANVITAMEMTVYIMGSVVKEANRITRERCENGSFQRDFCKGAANRIWYRCEELRKAAETVDLPEAKTGTALVLASMYKQELVANKNYIATTMGVKLRQGSSGRGVSTDGFSHGKEFGNRVSLNKQVGGGSNNPRLK